VQIEGLFSFNRERTRARFRHRMSSRLKLFDFPARGWPSQIFRPLRHWRPRAATVKFFGNSFHAISPR